LRVAADSIPRRRHAILAAILAASRPVRHADLAAQLAAKTSPTAVRRELEELEALGLAARVGTKPQAGDEWQLTPATAALARDVLNLPPGSVSPADSVETGAWQRYLRGPGPMLHALAELGVATFTDWLAASGLRKATFARYLSEMVAVPSEVVRRTDGRYTLVTEELRDTYLRLATLWRRVTQLRGSASTEQAP
jgi:DNA-binding IclR family transcriptional regulator